MSASFQACISDSGRADFLAPVPELEGHGEADACDPAGAFAEQILAGGDLGPEELGDRFGGGVTIADAGVAPDAAGEVDEHRLEAPASDLRADEEGALGVERHRNQRLADAAALRLAAAEQAVGLEMAHDDRDRLRREAGHPSDLRLGERALAANDAEHQPLVLGAHAGLVGPARDRTPPRRAFDSRCPTPSSPLCSITLPKA